MSDQERVGEEPVNKGTQGQPTTTEDGVEHNQHIVSPEEEAADREPEESDEDTDADGDDDAS